MPQSFPYIHFACPCSDITVQPNPQREENPQEEDQEEQTFNPYSSRANYALYPIESLLFCNECHELRCPRCYYEEALSYFCPRCLTERLAAEVRNESNSCPQSCHECPICQAPLVVNRFESPNITKEAQPSSTDGTYILSCPYCNWSSLDIGIDFKQGGHISRQLAEIKNGGNLANEAHNGIPKTTSDSTRQFFELASFYRSQIEETSPQTPYRDSPSQIARLLSTHGPRALKKPTRAVPVMREANTDAEGLTLYFSESDDHIIAKMKELCWDGTTSIKQRSQQQDPTQVLTSLRPIRTTLHTKRIKRCRNCRRQLIRPDNKKGSHRYSIKLVALKYIPRITLTPLDTTINLTKLEPTSPIQFLLAFHNPIYEKMKVTLATPRITPGRLASKVTILCPQFHIGANGDTFDAAIESMGGATKKGEKGDIVPAVGQQPEAGKVWERGRNWTSVVLEVVVGELNNGDEGGEGDQERFEEEMVKLPVFVRLEYEDEESVADPLTAGVVGGGTKVQRELAYWCVLSAGRIASTTGRR